MHELRTPLNSILVLGQQLAENGYEVARRLRDRAGLERVPLIAISGFSSDSDKRRATQAGFDRYFVKPVAYEKLHEVLTCQLNILKCRDV